MFLCDPPPFPLVSSLIPVSSPVSFPDLFLLVWEWDHLLLSGHLSVVTVCFCSGFWGVLCVGIFSNDCLIREVYEDLCFCLTTELPTTVSTLRCTFCQNIHTLKFHNLLLKLSTISQLENKGILFGYQLAGGLFIIAWSFIICSLLFLILWFFPVKFALACLPWWVKPDWLLASGLASFPGPA